MDQPEYQFSRNSTDDDYYKYFSIERDASTDEINNAYRRLSKIYHPDRHTDATHKLKASNLFNKIKKIHEVLIDPQKRAIYDSIGSNGLDMEGWQMVEKTRTAQDIRQEFERLYNLEEEKKVLMATNPRGSISVNLNASELFSPYDITTTNYDEEFPSQSSPLFQIFQSFIDSLLSIEVMGVGISQSVESPLSQTDNMTLSGSVNTKNGMGAGEVTTSLRHLHASNRWSEAQISVGNGLLIALKHFRALTPRCYLNGALITQLLPDGSLRPGIQATLSQQLDKHTTGQLSLSAGLSSSLVTSIIRQTDKSRFLTSLHLGIPHSYIHVSYTRHIYPPNFKIKSQLKLGTFGAMLEYGCEQRITSQTVVGAYLSVGVPFGVNLTLKVNRAQQNFSFVTLLSQELIPAPIIYGTVAPLLTYFFLKHVIVRPYLAKRDERKRESDRLLFSDRLRERKEEAKNTVDLMRETYRKNKYDESTKMGLVIERATYGKANGGDVSSNSCFDHHSLLHQEPQSLLRPNGDDLDDPTNAFASPEIPFGDTDHTMIDVTIPLQCLVNGSKLVIPQGTKANLPGFYDPCYGEAKQLFIKYSYRTVLHQATFDDEEPIRLPLSSHKIV